MDNPVDHYWRLRLAELKAVLEMNNFTVYLADNTKEAATLVQERIVAEIAPKSIAWGGVDDLSGNGPL